MAKLRIQRALRHPMHGRQEASLIFQVTAMLLAGPAMVAFIRFGRSWVCGAAWSRIAVYNFAALAALLAAYPVTVVVTALLARHRPSRTDESWFEEEKTHGS